MIYIAYMSDITVQELKFRREQGQPPALLIDVREPHERLLGHLGGEHIPMAALPPRLEELEPYRHQEIVLYCRSGGRSGQMATWLRTQGFTNVRNLLGGALAWKAEVDPTLNVT